MHNVHYSIQRVYERERGGGVEAMRSDENSQIFRNSYRSSSNNSEIIQKIGLHDNCELKNIFCILEKIYNVDLVQKNL